MSQAWKQLQPPLIVEKETLKNKDTANDLVNIAHPSLIYIASGIHMYNLARIFLPPHSSQDNNFPLQFPGGNCWDLLVIKLFLYFETKKTAKSLLHDYWTLWTPRPFSHFHKKHILWYIKSTEQWNWFEKRMPIIDVLLGVFEIVHAPCMGQWPRKRKTSMRLSSLNVQVLSLVWYLFFLKTWVKVF